MSDPMPYLERVKIQTEILLPLFRRMREELGNAKACELLRHAVNDYATSLGESIAAQNQGSPLAKLKAMLPVFVADDALDIEPLEDSEKNLFLNVRGCRYAEYFKELGEPEFGAMLTCEIDPPIIKGISADLALQRTRTIMSGATHCDFRWTQD